MSYGPDDISKDSQSVRIYCNDNPNQLDTKLCHCHSYLSQLHCGFTANGRQAWTNYENNRNYLVVGDVVRSEYSNIRYLHLIIGSVQNFVWNHKNDFQE